MKWDDAQRREVLLDGPISTGKAMNGHNLTCNDPNAIVVQDEPRKSGAKVTRMELDEAILIRFFQTQKNYTSPRSGAQQEMRRTRRSAIWKAGVALAKG